jgi:hypothetical protein
MPEDTCAHIAAVDTVKHAKRQECDECVKIGRQWVHLRPARVRRDVVLRQLAQPPREQARAQHVASIVSRTWRAVAVLLPDDASPTAGLFRIPQASPRTALSSRSVKFAPP